MNKKLFINAILLIITNKTFIIAQSKDVITSKTDSLITNTTDSLKNIILHKTNYELGTKDADLFYYKYNRIATIAAIMPVPINLIIDEVGSRRKPKLNNLNYPDAKLMRDDIYRNAYIDKAHSIKKEKLKKNIRYSLYGSTLILIGFFINNLKRK